MLPSINSCSILYTLFAWFLGMCYGFVLLSSATRQNRDVALFETGESLTYQFYSTVLLNEKNGTSKNVGFYIAGDVVVQTIWEHNCEKLLKIELKFPQLNIKSRKAPSPDGFIPHSSRLDSFKNKPFLLTWNKGKINQIFLPNDEEVSLANIKKGIASLLQFQLLDVQSIEIDASGPCVSTYTSLSPTKSLKTKTNCTSKDLPSIKNPDEILGVTVDSSRETEYELDVTNSYLTSIKSKETHKMYLPIKKEIGNLIEASQILDFVKREKTGIIDGDIVECAIEKISETDGIEYVKHSLLTQKEPIFSEDKTSFTKEVNHLRGYLKTENLGSLKPAKAFMRLVTIARSSSKEDISEALGSNKNKIILHQLYDILGYVQTKDSHEAAMKNLHFDKENQIDPSERYLWALSLSSHPNSDIIKDLLTKYTNLMNIPEKLKETLILTIASMTYKLSKLQGGHFHLDLIKEVEDTITNNLKYAKNEERYVFFRALRNLQSKSTIPLLLQYIKIGSQKEGVHSWRVIKSFNPKLWDKEVLKSAEKSLFQLDRKYDSSSRALAADILIKSQTNDKLLEHLLHFIISNDPAYEIKQYVFQRIKMIADEDPSFRERVFIIIKANKNMNNYSGVSPRGLSVALSRDFFKSPSSNGSLVSLQEIKGGILKRGTVKMVMQRNDIMKDILSLGIFSGGLSGFISSDGDPEEDEGSLTAGMELTVLGTQIRPFVFFKGQGNLMGHIWSGTASKKTPAFQALVLLHDHLEHLRLGSGFIAQLKLKGATSFDLSGKISISLWNRNADSLVEKSAGIVVIGEINVDSSFVKSQVDFSASTEPKLNLQTNIYFSSKINWCTRLTQPDSVFRHNIYKIERIPGSKHKLRLSKYKKSTVPGKTYSLNKMNDKLCSTLFR